MADAAENKQSFKRIVEWTREAIDKQFVQVIPLLEQNDVLVAANTEFAATGIAAYCKKPFVRTSFAPFLPGEKMPPPAFPYPKPNPIITPKLLLADDEPGIQLYGEGYDKQEPSEIRIGSNQ